MRLSASDGACPRSRGPSAATVALAVLPAGPSSPVRAVEEPGVCGTASSPAARVDEATSTFSVIAPSMSAMTMPLSSTRGPLRPSGAGRPISTTRLQVGTPGGDGRTSLTPSALSLTLRSGLLTSLASRPSAAWASGETSTRTGPDGPSGGRNVSSSAAVQRLGVQQPHRRARRADDLGQVRPPGPVQRLHERDRRPSS